MTFSCHVVAFLSLFLIGCSGGADTVVADPNAEPAAQRQQRLQGAADVVVGTLTGAHTRVVWVQGDGTDPDAGGDQLILMGFDSEDGEWHEELEEHPSE